MERDTFDYRLYVLEGHTPTPTDNVYTWGKWFEEANRHVARTTLESGICISTVFLGVDHAWGRSEEPVLFETMAFDPRKPRLDQWLDKYMRRYTTWEEAEAGHKEVVEEIKASEAKAQ